MKKIATVIGARPQFIKASAVSRVIEKHDGLKEIMIHTGQHFDENMSAIFFQELDISEPDYNLGIGGSSHGQMTGRQLEAIEKIFLVDQPDCVLVYGDTNSTLAGAIAASKLNIPLAHIEAGLRSFNRSMPEEINRILADHSSNILFSPTKIAKENLIREGIAEEHIFTVGDVMFDVSLHFQGHAKKPKWTIKLDIEGKDFVLATIHRAENTDNHKRLKGIFDGLSASSLPVIIPLHPRTQSSLIDSNIKLGNNIHVVDPVGYLEMIWLESNCKIICTDSGGVQKEAYFFRKPCLTIRDETEWVELVDSGWNVLVGYDEKAIASGINDFEIPKDYSRFYGNGDTAELIIDVIDNKVF
tara:strand:+ start:614 stop:1684 length:1071 start_codon:yes stop_codon:yes gene_type:complete